MIVLAYARAATPRATARHGLTLAVHSLNRLSSALPALWVGQHHRHHLEDWATKLTSLDLGVAKKYTTVFRTNLVQYKLCCIPGRTEDGTLCEANQQSINGIALRSQYTSISTIVSLFRALLSPCLCCITSISTN